MSLTFITITSVVISLILLFFERKVRKIEKNTDVLLLKVDAIMKKNGILYPLPDSLPEKAIELENIGKRVEACNEIIRKYQCSYNEAESSLKSFLSKKLRR